MPPTAIDSIARMRIALVSPYSWTFPGGVTRHIDALAREFLAEGHHVKVLSPVDPDDRLTRALHRRAPDPAPLPDYVVPLGRTFSLPMNGAMSRLAVNADSVIRLRSELRAGGFDVIHVHEPIAPIVGWDACTFDAGAPVVGTFHAYSSSWIPNTIARTIGARRVFNRLHARIAVSEAARWTGERYFGGTYDVIPNGVDTERRAARARSPPSDALRVVFVGREEERKGLPVLLSAFAGLRQHIPVRLQMIGAEADGVEPLLAQVEGGMDGIEVLGRVDDAELWRRLHEADVLCAPSLGGESFGMVLTEAFAAGTPVVASDIAGYRQVVTHGRDGLLTTPGDPLELAEALRSLWLDPVRRAQMSVAARERAEDFAWPQVARRVASRVRARRRGSRSRRRGADRARQGGARAARPHSQPPCAPPALDRAASAEGAARFARARRVAARRAGTVRDRRRAARLPRAAPRRFRQRRHDAACTRARSGC